MVGEKKQVVARSFTVKRRKAEELRQEAYLEEKFTDDGKLSRSCAEILKFYHFLFFKF